MERDEDWQIKLLQHMAQESKERVRREWAESLAKYRLQAQQDYRIWYEKNRRPDGSVFIRWLP